MSCPLLSIRSPQAIARAVECVKAGELIIIPTDTIYGIAALPEMRQTIVRLYEVRARKPEPASPFLLADRRHMEVLARVNQNAKRLAWRFWPGPLTLILPPNSVLPRAMQSYPVALRVPNFPMLKPLLEAVGGYLFTSGAIRSGHSPAITANEACDFFGTDVALILDGGKSPFGIPSTIVDCVTSPPQVVRRGAISAERISAALQSEAR